VVIRRISSGFEWRKGGASHPAQERAS